MNNDPVISVQNVSKAYRIWESPTARLLSPMQSGLAGLLPRRSGPAKWLTNSSASSYRDFYALLDVSFTVKRGESVGIIGRNGSGKSTLLQIIAGTLQPTEGSVKVNGRVAALLELGSGFNPEFTGRENVYLNAAVVGLSRLEVDKRFDAIAAFADIGDFIEQPVKTYSSGMMVRLAFAVQIQLEPEILIVDEALSVGDEPFQRKCFSKIALMQERGVTILFVSHSSATVIELCQRVILLDHGHHLLTARPKIAVQSYYQLCYSPASELARVRAEIASLAASGEAGPAPGPNITSNQAETVAERGQAYFLDTLLPASRAEFPSRGAQIESIQITDQAYRPVNVLLKGESYCIRCTVLFVQSATRVRFGWSAKNITGMVISGAATHPIGDGFPGFAANSRHEVIFNFRCLFNQGTYFIDFAVRAELSEPDMLIHGVTDALIFKVQPTPNSHRNGYVDTSGEPVWSLKTLHPAT